MKPMIDVEEMKDYLGDDGHDNDALYESSIADAETLIESFVGAATVPENIRDRATLLVAVDLWERRNAPNGIVNSQFSMNDGVTPMRVSRDPMQAAYPLLRRYVTPW